MNEPKRAYNGWFLRLSLLLIGGYLVATETQVLIGGILLIVFVVMVLVTRTEGTA